jgi:hypothetical protein
MPVVGVCNCGFTIRKAGPRLAEAVSLSILVGVSARPFQFSACENVALKLAGR